ncbi:3-isopropylmalate dehydrogenase [Paraburkholderia sediminicola]
MAGDDVGPEVMAEVKRVVDWFVATRNLRIDLHIELYGIAAWHAHGSTLIQPETWALLDGCDAILFGVTGSPEYEKLPKEERRPSNLLKIRHRLDLFDNRRPIRAFHDLLEVSSLRAEVIAGTDMVIVRELSGGLHFGEPRGIEAMRGGGWRAFNTMTYTTAQVERVARSAFELARSRRNKLCSVDKAHVLEVSNLWREEVTRLHASDYPDVELTHMYVDHAAMQLVRDPRQFDVIVTENLFGDILSDSAAMVAGSIGMLASASLGPPDVVGRRKALYEPVHGGIPELAGRGTVNPLGGIMCFALCLDFTFGLPEEGKLLERAVEAALAVGARTADIALPGARSIGTVEMGDAVLRALDRINTN